MVDLILGLIFTISCDFVSYVPSPFHNSLIIKYKIIKENNILSIQKVFLSFLSKEYNNSFSTFYSEK